VEMWDTGAGGFNIDKIEHNKRRKNMKKMMKKMMKKSDKGFTLVELIVVILIMAILAAALAPQVMKWVGNSKKSTDVTTYESMVSSVNLAVTKDTVASAIKTQAADITITITSGADITILPAGAGVTALDTELQSYLGTTYKTQRAKVSGGSYTIVINATTLIVSKGTTPTSTMD